MCVYSVCSDRGEVFWTIYEYSASSTYWYWKGELSVLSYSAWSGGTDPPAQACSYISPDDGLWYPSMPVGDLGSCHIKRSFMCQRAVDTSRYSQWPE